MTLDPSERVFRSFIPRANANCLIIRPPGDPPIDTYQAAPPESPFSYEDHNKMVPAVRVSNGDMKIMTDKWRRQEDRQVVVAK